MFEVDLKMNIGAAADSHEWVSVEENKVTVVAVWVAGGEQKDHRAIKHYKAS